MNPEKESYSYSYSYFVLLFTKTLRLFQNEDDYEHLFYEYGYGSYLSTCAIPYSAIKSKKIIVDARKTGSKGILKFPLLLHIKSTKIQFYLRLNQNVILSFVGIHIYNIEPGNK